MRQGVLWTNLSRREISQRLAAVGQFISPWAAFRAIHSARVDGFLRDASGYAGTFSVLAITECGVARLEEPIHHDRTRTVRDVANAALADMGLPA